MDFNMDMNSGLGGLDDLDNLMGDLGADLSDNTVQIEKDVERAAAEGFACLFPDWDLKPVRR